MRINEYGKIEDFVDEYTGIWNPSEGHWYGLDFSYHNETYRLNTGMMYEEDDVMLPDNRSALYGLYKKKNNDDDLYSLIGRYAAMDDLLESIVIEQRPFREIIMDDSTEILGKD